jgi:hypothetical protein
MSNWSDTKIRIVWYGATVLFIAVMVAIKIIAG